MVSDYNMQYSGLEINSLVGIEVPLNLDAYFEKWCNRKAPSVRTFRVNSEI